MKKQIMKKQIFVILILLLLSGCQTTDSAITTQSEPISVDMLQDKSLEVQDDLVYHDYGTSIFLKANSSATISNLDLGLKEESANLYAISLKTNEMIILGNYEANQTVSFTSKTDGNYLFLAITSAGNSIDITPNAVIETTYELDESNGIIPLK